MKRSRDIIPILVPAIFAVLGLLGFLVMLGPAITPYERDCFEFLDKGELPFGETLTEQFTYTSYDYEWAAVHVYDFHAREGQSISFRVESQTLYGLVVCIAETPSYDDCLLPHESMSEDESKAILEFDLPVPHDGQYFLLLRCDGFSIAGYQISMTDGSEETGHTLGVPHESIFSPHHLADPHRLHRCDCQADHADRRPHPSPPERFGVGRGPIVVD